MEKFVRAKRKGTKIETNPKSVYPCIRGDASTRPRKGTFEVRLPKKKGKKIVSLIGMSRPFTKLKALDIESLAESVLKALA